MAKTVASFTTETDDMMHVVHMNNSRRFYVTSTCLLYTSDAADDSVVV